MTEWLFIDYSKYDAPFNMALDVVIAEQVIAGDLPVTLRLYGWSSPSVSLGFFQKSDDINLSRCDELNIPVVRRPTGGRAILHDDEITYSFSVKTPNNVFSDSLLENYRLIGLTFRDAFSKVGIETEMSEKRLKRKALLRSSLCFQSTSYGEITLKGKKIIGSAQKRYKDGFLQQGSVPFVINSDLSGEVFSRFSESDLTGLREVSEGITHKEIAEALRKSFEERFDIKFLHDKLPDECFRKAESLSENYSLT